ncbi:hypothetical protein D3C85_1036390 [compost metagenome]
MFRSSLAPVAIPLKEIIPLLVAMKTSPVVLLILISLITLLGKGELLMVKWYFVSSPFGDTIKTPESAVPIHLLLAPSTAIEVINCS